VVLSYLILTFCLFQGQEITPAPINVNWYTSRNADQNVKQSSEDTRLSFAEKLDAGFKEGFVQGSIALPVDGQWLLQLYVGGASFDKNAPSSQEWPTENAGVPDATDSVKMTFNGEEHIWTNDAQFQGKKTIVIQQIVGNVLNYRFDFKSSSTIIRLHPLVSNGQITIVQDKNSFLPQTVSSGNIFGKCINGVDGKIIKPGDVISNGGLSPGNTMKIPDGSPEVHLSLFLGSTLVMTVPVRNGQFSVSVPAGKYGVIATMPHFDAFYDEQFEVVAGQNSNLLAVLSPVLNPGMTRVVLVWGANPKDLDSYMSSTSTDSSKPGCLVSYKKKKCDR
jgi:hypothetical protein